MTKSAAIIGAGISGLCTGALLAKQGFQVEIFEKSLAVGGRTMSIQYKDHILDNGFHIMPFYKTSAVYQVLKEIGIVKKLKLTKVHDIVFYENNQFYKYPKGIAEVLGLSLLPLQSRISLLRLLIPMAFSSIQRSEKLDDHSLTEIISKLDPKTKKFFDAVCMLAFADTPDHVALGEFVRTIIRANPLKGGTSEFAYPADGGYDTICKLIASYIEQKRGTINLGQSVKQIKIENNTALGVITANGDLVKSDCVIVSYPAYIAVKELFKPGTFEPEFLNKIERLNKTTSVIEVHFCLSEQIDTRQVVFPVGDYTTKGIFFVSNITDSVSPKGQHLVMAGTPVPTEYAENPTKIKEITQKMKSEISQIYPNFVKSLLWERPMSWKLVEAVVKEPGIVWKQKMPHQTGIKGLFFVGDSTVSYGIGTDSAAHSSILCHPQIISYLA